MLTKIKIQLEIKQKFTDILDKYNCTLCPPKILSLRDVLMKIF